MHIVNFGGEFSVNSLVEGEATENVGTDLSVRAIRTENVPDVMTIPQFMELMQQLAAFYRIFILGELPQEGGGDA